MHYAILPSVDQRGVRQPGETAGLQPQPVFRYRRPPQYPAAQNGLSGRPFCRIYFSKGAWILELEPGSAGWLDPQLELNRSHDIGAPPLSFPTLKAAIAYAERHGLDYRVIYPRHRNLHSPRRRSPSLPRSWRTILARNGQNTEMYHG